MLRILKKLVLYSFIALVGILLLFSALIFFNKEALKNNAVTELNEFLDAPVSIQHVDISLKKFPKAAIALSHVYSNGAHSKASDTLLYAKQLYLEFHLWHIWNSPLRINQISIEEGILDIKMRPNQKDNFRIWKEPKDTSEKSTLFGIESIELNNMKVNYQQSNPNVAIKSFQKSALLSGAFVENGFEFNVAQNGRLFTLIYDQNLYAKNVQVKSKLKVEEKENRLTIKNGSGVVNEIPIEFSGNFDDENMLFTCIGSNLSGKTLYNLAKDQNYLQQHFESIEGTVQAKLVYQQAKNKTGRTTINGRFDNAEVKADKFNISKASAAYTYSFEQNHHLDLHDFTIALGSGTAKGNVSIYDFDHPKTKGNIEADLSLSDWKQILNLDTLVNEKGRIKLISEFSAAFGNAQKITPNDLSKAKIKGEIDLIDINFGFKNANQTVKNLRGKISINESNVALRELFLQTGKSDLFIDGELKNLLNWIYFPDEKLVVDGRLKAQELVLEDLISNNSTTSQADEYDLSFTKNLSVQLSLDVLKFSFSTFSATNVLGDFDGKNAVFYGKKLSMETCGGEVSGNFELNTNTYPYSGSGVLTLKNVDVQKAFLNFQNFGQNVLTAQNLKGTTSAKIIGSGKLDKSLSIITNTISATADISISKGQLIDFEPMNALSDYAEVSELKNITFEDLQNSIKIENSELYIPKMIIRNSVVNISLLGTHTFTNTINYTVGLKLGEVLFNKRRQKNKQGEFDAYLVEQTDEDDPTLYLKMMGKVDAPVIVIDKAAIGESIKQDLKNQGTEIKKIFKKEPEKQQKKGSGIIYTWPDEDDG